MPRLSPRPSTIPQGDKNIAYITVASLSGPTEGTLELRRAAVDRRIDRTFRAAELLQWIDWYRKDPPFGGASEVLGRKAMPILV
jgi:hypothetical protein